MELVVVALMVFVPVGYFILLDEGREARRSVDGATERMRAVLEDLAKAPCMGRLLGEECGWCPSCRAGAVLRNAGRQ